MTDYEKKHGTTPAVGDHANEHAAVPATAAEAVRNIKSPGILRIEALASVITLPDRIAIFFSIFLVA